MLKKSPRNICIYRFLAVILHPLSPPKRGLKTTKQVLKNFRFFCAKRFGSSKNLPYLCTRFHLRNEGDCKRVLQKIFQNIFEKDLAVSKIVLTFAPLSAPKNRKLKIKNLRTLVRNYNYVL